MTQEEKAKAYDEALEIAKNEINIKGIGETVELCERLFPELRESEDERMRKELIEAFEAYDIESSWNLIPVKHILAWLEKQKEQKSAEWSEEDEQLIGFIFDLLNGLVWRKDWAMSKEECLERLKSLRPSWKPSEEQMSMLLAVINDPNNAGAESCQIALKSLYEHLKKLM